MITLTSLPAALEIALRAEFHYLIYAACGNAELTRVARNLWDRSYRFRAMALRNEENARRGLAQHADILAALRARDLERAAALAEEHDHSTIRHLRSRMKSVADPGDGGPAPS